MKHFFRKPAKLIPTPMATRIEPASHSRPEEPMPYLGPIQLHRELTKQAMIIGDLIEVNRQLLERAAAAESLFFSATAVIQTLAQEHNFVRTRSGFAPVNACPVLTDDEMAHPESLDWSELDALIEGVSYE